MTKGLKALALTALAMATVVTPAWAQSHQTELKGDLESIRTKIVGLAEHVPEADYTWRPGDGVRSIGEVYMHMASANFRFPGMIESSPPEGTPEAWTRGNAEDLDRGTAVAALNASFDFLIEVVDGVTDSQLEETMEVFGRPTNVRGFLMLMQTHLHEHLGQSIAYARTQGVVPPWSM